MMNKPRTKERFSVTVDITVINKIEELKNNTKYANRSSISNELLLLGLEAKGIKL
jgi:metal-responsive CopG/Arc/MetJ family transcriptional regulator